MQITFYDKDMNETATADNALLNAIKIKKASLTSYFEEATHSVEFEFSKETGDWWGIHKNGFLAFMFKGDFYRFNIVKFKEDAKTNTINIIGDYFNLEMLNENCLPYQKQPARTIYQHLLAMEILPYANFELGVNELASSSRVLEFTGEDLKYKRLISIINAFGGECQFRIQQKPNGDFDKLMLDIFRENDGINYQGVGKDRTDFEINVDNSNNVVVSNDITAVITSLEPIGKDGLRLGNRGTVWKNKYGEVEFEQRNNRIYAVKAAQEMPRVLDTDKYLLWKQIFEIDNLEKLESEGYKWLKNNCYSKDTVEVTGSFNVGIGDTVVINHKGIGKYGLLGSLRVSKIVWDLLDETNEVTFANFKKLSSQISAIGLALQDSIKNLETYNIKFNMTSGTVFRNNYGQTRIIPRLYRNDTLVNNSSWLWHFKGNDYNQDSFTVNATDVSLNEKLEVSAILNGEIVKTDTLFFTNIMDNGQINTTDGKEYSYPLFTMAAHDDGVVRPEIKGSTVSKNGRALDTKVEIVTSHYPMYDRAVNFDTLVNLKAKIKDWSDGYFDFLQHNTSDISPLAINSLGLVGGSYITDDPKTSYTPPTTGTSEAQLLVLRGLLRQYIATQDSKWKILAEKVTNGLLNYYYPTETIPLTSDASWVPHWLVNVTEPFISREYFTDGLAIFENGIATININMINKVYSVRSKDSTLEYIWSPDSPVIGTSYEIEKTVISDDSTNATIILKDKTFNGEALFVYSSNTGITINVGDKCEAFPVWRPLNPGEIACAVDTLPWALECFQLWFEITNDTKWLNAIDCTKAAILNVSNVTNTIYYLKAGLNEEPVLKNGITNYSERQPKETYTNLDGIITIDYQAVDDQSEGSIGTWVGNKVPLNSERWIEAQIKSDKVEKLTLKIDEEETFDASKRWKCDFYTSGINVLQTLTFKHDDFYKDDKVLWGSHYGHDANSSHITSANSSVTTTEKIIGQKKITEFNFKRGDEGGWLGWSQSMLSIWGVKLPFDIKYKTNSRIYFRVNDSDGKNWSYELPKTGDVFKTITLTESLVAQGGTMSSGDYQSIILESIDENTAIQIEYFGTLDFLDKFYYSTIHLSYSGTESLQVGLKYLKPAPSRDDLPYAPYIMPFDMHYINYELSNLRGAIYSGYQAPWIYQESIFDDAQKALNTNLQFLNDSQNAYKNLTGFDGFFAPIFWWDYLDDASGHEKNTFGIKGNWGNVWGGFQYRTVSDVAKVFVKDTVNLQAYHIVIRFLRGVKKYWDNTLIDFPTAFVENSKPYNDQKDPHMVTNLMRALSYTLKYENLSTDDLTLIEDLFEKCINYLHYNWIESNGFSYSLLEGTWTPDIVNKTWFEYWGGDILDTLGLLQISDLSRLEKAFSYALNKETNKTIKFKLDSVESLSQDDRLYLDYSDEKWKFYNNKTGLTSTLSDNDQYKMNNIKTYEGGTYLYLNTDKDIRPLFKGEFKSAQWYLNYKIQNELQKQSTLSTSVKNTLVDLLLKMNKTQILSNEDLDKLLDSLV
ncbi:hypothetical protein K7G42_01065 [Streptococcus parauberis]|uniref:Anti-receptor protein n=1 Tax=Streptococcus parauberis KRS-02083 TaxID=1207545 RepID=A0ABN0IP88_9STRE|nr:hypothetical protein [Streptococcus parauberis]EMG24645.1 putative anti-receptor protein [Streptococcus parauberis KRS-02083]QBX27515.1 tail fibers protein [Streptococcus phage Javan394]WEM65286.1 hypothetical protein P1T45_01085 [Streptococcus parauberis]WOF47152.1 hypothetical protein K7G42_01065 [Streptococcus parauberis]